MLFFINEILLYGYFYYLVYKTASFSLIIAELDQINTIVGEFLLLEKPQNTYYEVCNIVDVIEDVKKLFEIRATTLNIEIQLVFEDNNLL